MNAVKKGFDAKAQRRKVFGGKFYGLISPFFTRPISLRKTEDAISTFGMVHSLRENIFTNLDWGQGTWDARELQSQVPSLLSQIVKIA